MTIDRIEARAIADSRGSPTVEATMVAGEITATASVPSGKSTGSHEAVELRDSDGGVTQAVSNVNDVIAHAIAGRDFSSADELDVLLFTLDGTPNKARLGANALLAVSMAAARLFAKNEGVPLWRSISHRAQTTPRLPRLFVNVLNGGAHASFHLPFQEYLLVVEGPMGTALPVAQEAFAKVGEKLGTNVPMGDEGGYAPTFDTLDAPFDLLTEATAPFQKVSLAIDAAANELYHDGVYTLLKKQYTPDQLENVYEDLIARYSLHSIEDPFEENAGEDFGRLAAAIGANSMLHEEKGVFVIGDDLTVTTPSRIQTAAKQGQIGGVIIKPNQIGTVHEALKAVQTANAANLAIIASHRSGETEDTFIADFAYGVGAHGIKAGGFGQRQRILKYDRLRAIEREAETV